MKKLLILVLIVLGRSFLDAQSAMDFFNAGHIKYDSGDYEGAIKEFDKAIQLKPNYAEAFEQRGLAKCAIGKLEVGLLDFNKAIKFDPRAAGYYYNRGHANDDLERNVEAIRDYDLAISLDLKLNGEPEIGGCIRLDPMLEWTYFNRGKLKHENGEYTDAIRDFDQAIAINPRNEGAYVMRGYSKRNLGHYEDAILDYDKAIAINPNNWMAYNNRGDSNEHLGNFSEAILDFRKALKIAPNDEIVKKNILQLERKVKSTMNPKVWAVAVGVSRYKASHIFSTLNTTDDHAQEFARLLERYGITEQSEIPVLTDTKATHDQIMLTLKSVFLDPSKVGVNDMVIFFFSGHGEAVNGKAGLCPYDYSDPRDLILESEIWSILNNCPARHKLCFIEACKTENNTMDQGLSDEERKEMNRARQEVSGGIVYFTSTKAGGKSIELSNEHGAIFSYHLLNGLKGLADTNGDRTVTIEELFNYVSKEVKSESNGTQFPQINTGGFNWTLPILVLPRK